MFLRINIFHRYYPANISTSDQGCFNVVDHRSNNFDPTLKMKQISEVGFLTLNKIDTMWVSSVEATLNQRCTTSMEPFSTLYNFASTLFQHWYDVIWKVVSTWPQLQLKLYWSQSGWWKVWISRKIDNFYSTKWENILYNVLTI